MTVYDFQPLVLVTQRIDIFPERSEIRDSLDQKLIDFLSTLGILPIPVSNTLVSHPKGLENLCKKLKPNGVVFSGGGKLGDCINRDKTELFLFNYAKENNLPLLGICRGMQIMSQINGGEIEFIQSHVNTRHKLIPSDKKVAIPKVVNSYHEYGLRSCPTGFDVIATAEDGSIEAIKHNILPWLGLMWHPEREVPFSKSDLEKIKKLFFIL